MLLAAGSYLNELDMKRIFNCLSVFSVLLLSSSSMLFSEVGTSDQKPACKESGNKQTGLERLLSVVKGAIRFTNCKYKGTTLLNEQTFLNDRIEGDSSSWRLKLDVRSVGSVQEVFDVKAIFRVSAGEARSTAVAIHFDFGDWTPDNYVMVPASVYNGNRYPVLGSGYNPPYTLEMFFNPALPLTISDNPHLSMDRGTLSSIELQTGNAATPAVCWYSAKAGKGFILLTEQQTRWGNNGLSITENKTKDSCTVSLVAPAMRKLASGFGDYHASGDMAPDWKAGDETTIRFRVYVFDAHQIPDVLDKYMTIRKELNGPNQPRNLVPMSKLLDLGRGICSHNFIRVPAGAYYKPENDEHFQLGWVSGMMNTYPMLASGVEKERRRVMEELDFVTSSLQGRSGYFYGGCLATGKLRSDKEEAGCHITTAMVRKNGDALFWLMKHLLLFRAQGYGDSIKLAWELAARRLASAFTTTWKKNGQFGQYVLPETGEIAVFNSTGGGIAPAGLVLAADYFHNPEWLKVAGDAALYYYKRDVAGQGLTGGDCGDISQDANSESAFAFLESLVALYQSSGEERWLKMAQTEAALCATWALSYDPVFPPNSTIGKLNGHMAGAVWASIQNKHAAPGICTSSGDYLFKLFRITGDHRYAELIRDIQHAQTEAVNMPGHITSGNLIGSCMERIQPSDAESRGSTGNFIDTRNSWTETDGMLMALELPGIYLRTDKRELFIFDHVEAKILPGASDYVRMEIHNGTPYDAEVAVMAETGSKAPVPMGYTAFLQWPKVKIEAGRSIVISVYPDGKVK
ncbi:hypothetical protein ACX0G9_13310 [Flavitalea flava]